MAIPGIIIIALLLLAGNALINHIPQIFARGVLAAASRHSKQRLSGLAVAINGRKKSQSDWSTNREEAGLLTNAMRVTMQRTVLRSAYPNAYA